MSSDVFYIVLGVIFAILIVAIWAYLMNCPSEKENSSWRGSDPNNTNVNDW